MSRVDAAINRINSRQEMVEKAIFPAQPLQNPKGQGQVQPDLKNSEHAKAITTLKSGKVIGFNHPSVVDQKIEEEEFLEEQSEEEREEFPPEVRIPSEIEKVRLAFTKEIEGLKRRHAKEIEELKRSIKDRDEIDNVESSSVPTLYPQ